MVLVQSAFLCRNKAGKKNERLFFEELLYRKGNCQIQNVFLRRHEPKVKKMENHKLRKLLRILPVVRR
jgi:hypothetical protein